MAFFRGLSVPSAFSQRKAIYQSIANIPQVMGAMIYLPPQYFYTGYRQYTTSPLDQDLAFLSSIGKYLAVEILTDVFQNNFPSYITPAYWYSSSDPNYSASFAPSYYTGASNPNNPVAGVTRLAEWVPAVTNELLLLQQFLASKLDSNPTLEAICTNDETTPSDAGFIPGFGSSVYPTYSSAAWLAGQRALVSGMGAAWKQTNATIQYNWLPTTGPNTFGDFGALIAASQCAFSGPDTLPNGTNGTNTYIGAASYGGKDYRGIVPGMWQVQSPDIQGSLGASQTPQTVYNFANNTLKSTHMFWAYQQTTNSADWASSVLPFIKTHPLSNTAYPTGYPQ